MVATEMGTKVGEGAGGASLREGLQVWQLQWAGPLWLGGWWSPGPFVYRSFLCLPSSFLLPRFKFGAKLQGLALGFAGRGSQGHAGFWLVGACAEQC